MQYDKCLIQKGSTFNLLFILLIIILIKKTLAVKVLNYCIYCAIR